MEVSTDPPPTLVARVGQSASSSRRWHANINPKQWKVSIQNRRQKTSCARCHVEIERGDIRFAPASRGSAYFHMRCMDTVRLPPLQEVVGYEDLGATARGTVASHFEARRNAEMTGPDRTGDAMGVDEEGDVMMGTPSPSAAPAEGEPNVVLPTHLPARPGGGLYPDGQEDEEDAGLDDEVEGEQDGDLKGMEWWDTVGWDVLLTHSGATMTEVPRALKVSVAQWRVRLARYITQYAGKVEEARGWKALLVLDLLLFGDLRDSLGGNSKRRLVGERATLVAGGSWGGPSGPR